jgi:hypothetical protein
MLKVITLLFYPFAAEGTFEWAYSFIGNVAAYVKSSDLPCVGQPSEIVVNLNQQIIVAFS